MFLNYTPSLSTLLSITSTARFILPKNSKKKLVYRIPCQVRVEYMDT